MKTPHSRLRAAHWLCHACAALLLLPACALADPPRPNVLLIVAEELGYSDVGCFGGEIETPTLDSLAEGGLRYTQFYNASRSAPSHASMLTGLYPHQAGLGGPAAPGDFPGYRGELNFRSVTLAEVLRTAGYRTYMLGTWHGSLFPSADQVEQQELDLKNWPLQRGFDRFFGTIGGGGSYFDPAALARDNRLVAPDPDSEFYYPDALSDAAAETLREHDSAQPFFLCLSYPTASGPLHAKPADLEKYEGRYDQGWDKVREARLQRLKDLGIIGLNVSLSAHARPWDREERREWQSDRMEAYAAMVDAMDQGIGKVVEALRETGQLDNTLILYVQAGGASDSEVHSAQPRRSREGLPAGEPRPADTLQLEQVAETTRDGQPVRWGRGVTPGPADTYVELGREWANAANTPFRLYRGYTHEGGIATPMIAHWPQGIERAGMLERHPAHLIDLMPTLLELTGATYPETFHDDEEIRPLEGVSLVPSFSDQPIDRSPALFWEHEGSRAVRQGNWKLVARGPKGKWQLYNLGNDRSEMNDMADLNREKVAELRALWQTWAARAQVLPLVPHQLPPENAEQGASEANSTRSPQRRAG